MDLRKNFWLSLGSLIVSQLAVAQGSDKKWEVYGFVQSDYVQDYRRVNPAWESTLRPSKIPTKKGLYGSDGQATLSVRQSRFGVQGNLPVNDQMIFTRFEFDMFGVGDDEGQTTMRLRHAYGKYGKWTGGQTHSLFMDIDLFPNTIDYWGPAGMVFLRNPQIRYDFMQGDNELAVAIEKPSNDIDPGQLRQTDADQVLSGQSDEKYPDVTVLTRMNRDWGHLQVSGILRSIGYETLGNSTNEPKVRRTGWGVNLGSNLKVGEKDKLIFGAVYGRGIASYINDGGNDMGAEGTLANPRATLLPLLGITAWYNRYWSEKYSSAIGYSRVQVDNSSLQNNDAFKRGEYAAANLLYYPARNVIVGGELLWGTRTDKNSAFGDDIRTQISFKYSFSSLDF